MSFDTVSVRESKKIAREDRSGERACAHKKENCSTPYIIVELFQTKMPEYLGGLTNPCCRQLLWYIYVGSISADPTREFIPQLCWADNFCKSAHNAMISSCNNVNVLKASVTMIAQLLTAFEKIRLSNFTDKTLTNPGYGFSDTFRTLVSPLQFWHTDHWEIRTRDS